MSRIPHDLSPTSPVAVNLAMATRIPGLKRGENSWCRPVVFSHSLEDHLAPGPRGSLVRSRQRPDRVVARCEAGRRGFCWDPPALDPWGEGYCVTWGHGGSSFPQGWERTCCDSAAVRDSTSRSVPCHEKDRRHKAREHSTHVTTVHNQGTALCEFTHSLTRSLTHSRQARRGAQHSTVRTKTPTCTLHLGSSAEASGSYSKTLRPAAPATPSPTLRSKATLACTWSFSGSCRRLFWRERLQSFRSLWVLRPWRACTSPHLSSSWLRRWPSIFRPGFRPTQERGLVTRN